MLNINFNFNSIRCGVEVKLWRAISEYRTQLRCTDSTDTVVTGDGVPNHLMRCPIISVSEMITTPSSNADQNCGNNVNSNSYDSNSNHATSSDDYESCNGSN